MGWLLSNKNFIAPVCHEQIEIVYQDHDIVVISKPSGLLSVPGRLKENFDSVASRLQALFCEVHIVHRLDMDTSGLMVVALNKQAHRDLSIQFQDRKTEKKYQAVVLGNLLEEEGEINLPIMTDWPNRPLQKVDFEQGKPSQTLYKVLEHFQQCGKVVNRVDLTPITGRSHQLRIHLSEIGHPIVGCSFYGNEQSTTLATRLLLHARQLGFTHPISLEYLLFDSVVPF